MRHREKKKLIETAGITAVIFAAFIIMAMMPGIFKKIDCANARRNISFIEDCQQHDTCTLTDREMDSFEGYTRLMLKTCPKD